MLEIRKLAVEAKKIKMNDYKENGIPHNFGRKVGSKESRETFMNKQTTKDIIYLLSFKDNTLREIAKMVKCSTKTVQKVKNIVNQLSTPQP